MAAEGLWIIPSTFSQVPKTNASELDPLLPDIITWDPSAMTRWATTRAIAVLQGLELGPRSVSGMILTTSSP